MASLTGKGESYHVSLWTGAEKQWFSGPHYTSVIKHTIYVSEVTIFWEKNVLEKCVMSMACILHHILKTTEVKMKRKVPDPLVRSAQGTTAARLPSRGKAMLKCVPLKFWNYPVSVLQVGGWPNYSDQGADTLESNQTVLYWVILVASESTVCVASLSIASSF